MNSLSLFKFLEESYRGRKAAGPVSGLNAGTGIQSDNGPGVVQNAQQTSRPSPQPAQAVHMLKPEQQAMSAQQQPMTPMPFYADPNRFATPVWQAEATPAWPQSQFIQQIQPANHGTTIESYQQYPNSVYQTTYQQPAFEANTFYTGAVQVVTSPRPPSTPNNTVQPLPRPNSNYSQHTPSPAPQNAQNSTSNLTQYQEYTIQNQSYNQPATPTGNDSNNQNNISRPSSVNSTSNVAQNSQSYNNQTATVFTSVNNDTFSPSESTNYVNSGNDKPGYLQVNSHPQLVSHSSSGYPGRVYSGSTLHDQQIWHNNNEQVVWTSQEIAKEKFSTEQNQKTEILYNNQAPDKPQNISTENAYANSDKINLNTKIKTMILNKQSENERNEQTNDTTGHFLWYSHQRYLLNSSNAGGIFQNTEETDKKTGVVQEWIKNNDQTKLVKSIVKQSLTGNFHRIHNVIKKINGQDKSKLKPENEPPPCQCLKPDQIATEPGAYYTHLGCADSLKTLRKDLENKTGLVGKAIRIEKVRYTGKEGKTAQGCPIAKWILRRSTLEEKYLVIVKHRPGHFCRSAFIIICIVVWEGLSKTNSDDLYNILTEKLNKFGLPTKRRCSLNEPRNCACQGLDPNTCGASFSFGCSWSMYYNGCKFTRSKFVRKFRLNLENEEKFLENKLQNLADYLSPLYRKLAPDSFNNQIGYEHIASDCRLGTAPGRPFSGVTACMDFCAHAHKDLHNMNNGCTVVVTLSKDKALKKDEQLHVLPLYVVENTDEFNSFQNQELKIKSGFIEVLQKFSSEIRLLNGSAEPFKKKNKRKSEDNKKKYSSTHISPVKHQKNIEDSQKFNNYLSNNDEIQLNGYHRYNNDIYNVQNNMYGPQFNNSNYNGYYPFPYQTTVQNNTAIPNLNNYYYNNKYNYSQQYYPDFNYQQPVYNYYQTGVVQINNNVQYNSITNIQPVEQKRKVFSDNLECFKDSDIGGVAIALDHGSILFECAKHELHATTALKEPNRISPTRISLVFYQHRNLNKHKHGLDEFYEKKLNSQKKCDTLNAIAPTSDIFVRASSKTTNSWTTLFPMYPCITTGFYPLNSSLKSEYLANCSKEY